MDISFNWKQMTDGDLEKRAKEEGLRAKRALSKQDRAIAHKNADAIMREQIARYEKKFFG